MYNLKVFYGPDLYMDHKQHGFGEVLQLAVNSLVAVQQQRAVDYRIEMTNKAGDTFFFAIGEKTKHPMNCNNAREDIDHEPRISDR
jgi:hypothetical protein